jgi:hypothetical protein
MLPISNTDPKMLDIPPVSVYHYKVIRKRTTVTSLTSDDIQNILTLIDFHDDWDEVKDVWGFDIEPLFNKLNDMLQDA